MVCLVTMNRPDKNKFVYPKIFKTKSEEIMCWEDRLRRDVQESEVYQQSLTVQILCEPKSGLTPGKYEITLKYGNKDLSDDLKMYETDYKFENNPPKMIVQPHTKFLISCDEGEDLFFDAQVKGPDLEFEWYKCATAKKAETFKNQRNVKGCHVMSKSHTHKIDSSFSFRNKKTTKDSGGFYVFEVQNEKYNEDGTSSGEKNRLVSEIVEVECYVPTNTLYVVLIIVGSIIGFIILIVAVYYSSQMTCWPSYCDKSKSITKKEESFEIVMKKKKKKEYHYYNGDVVPKCADGPMYFHYTFSPEEILENKRQKERDEKLLAKWAHFPGKKK